jgi:hypothetical protein
MKNRFIRTIIFVVIIIFTLIQCNESKVQDKKVAKINWDTDTIKSVKISEKFIEINTKGDTLKKIAFDNKVYDVEVLYKRENDLALKILLKNNIEKNPVQEYIKNAKKNELSYLTEDWQTGLKSIANPFHINYALEHNKYEIPNWFEHKDKFIDSLILYADEENYSFKEWKKMYSHISMNLEYEYHFVSRLMNDLKPIFDISNLKNNEQQEIETKLPWFSTFSVPITLSIDKKSSNQYLLKVIDISNIKEINQERLKTQGTKIIGNEYISFTVRQILPKESSILIELTEEKKELKKIIIDLFEEDLIDNSRSNRKIIIEIE